jgi:hypothetical protein
MMRWTYKGEIFWGVLLEMGCAFRNAIHKGKKKKNRADGELNC